MSFPNLPAEYEDPWYTKFINWATNVQNRITGTETVANAAVPFKGSLGTQNLNTVMTPGVYRQPTAVNATTALNYPAETQGGVLEVLAMDAGNTQILQRWTPLDGVAGFPRGAFIRRGYGGSWSGWQFQPTVRVDTSAGRAIYTWDSVNNREQLVYGDTGIRDVSGLLINGWAGTVRMYREGYRVTVEVESLNGSSATDPAFLTIPAGFTQTNPIRGLAHTADNSPAVRRFALGSGNTLALTAANGTSTPYFGTAYWRSNAAWPTVLPGTASGSIPNA